MTHDVESKEQSYFVLWLIRHVTEDVPLIQHKKHDNDEQTERHQPRVFTDSSFFSTGNASLPIQLFPSLGLLSMSHRLHTRLPQMDLWCALALYMGPPLNEMSSDSVSGRTSCGSGFHPPNLTSASRSMCYNLIRVSSASQSSRERHSSKPDDFDFDDFAPVSAPKLQVRCESYIGCKDSPSFLMHLSQSLQGNLSPTHRVGAKEPQ